MIDYNTSGEHVYIGKDFIEPGKSGTAYIWFITPEVYPKSLWVDRIIEIKEGSRIIGKAKVLKIFNKILVSENNKIKKYKKDEE
jgi:elongation factor Tu